MKNISFLLLFIVISCTVFPQQKKDTVKTKSSNRFYLDASVGLSLPLGAYASVDRDNSKSGYATGGYFAQVSLDWLGKSDFGIAFQYCFQHNPLNSKADSIIPYGTTYPLGSGGWTNNYLMAGVVFLKQMNRLSVDVRFLVGVLISSSPVFSTPDPVTNQNTNNTATGFAYGLNIGIGYAVSPRVTLKASLGYLEGYPVLNKQYSSIVSYDSVTATPIYSTIDLKKKNTTATFNAGLGIIYKF
jgi:hypothetical protein